MRALLILRRRSGKRPLFLLVVIIALSAYTHMWNPAGFPILHDDEGIYVRRGAGVLDHGILHGKYDHPFFGQVVIAGFMHITGYQDLIDNPSTDPSHLEAFYAYPRAFMGLLAVLDTLLVYLIADRMFGRRVAAVAAVIFAVAPMSLLLRMVLLDSILLPFVLSSVLLALHSRGSGRRHLLLLASGACMGLAILTKVPAAAMVPPCAILAYWASGRIRDVGLWLVPALAIPAVWPAYAARAGQFDLWIGDVMWQAGRSNGGLPEATRTLFEFDPILMPLGMAGFVFAVICLAMRLGRGRRAVWMGDGKRGGPSHDPARDRRSVLNGAVHTGHDRNTPRAVELKNLGFLAAWFSSILLFFGAIGFASFYHLSMLLPALCVAAAMLILWAGGGLLTRGTGGRTGDRTALIAVLAIGLAGLFTTGVIVHFDTQSDLEAASFVLQNYSDDPDTVKVLSTPLYWILSDVYGLQNTIGFPLQRIFPAPGASDLTVQNPTGFSDHYVQPDAESVILVFNSHNKKFFADMLESCDYAIDSANTDCHNAYNILRLYNDGNLIKEFGNDASIDAFPSLPSYIERHLIAQTEIIGLTPAK